MELPIKSIVIEDRARQDLGDIALEERYPDTVGPADTCARLGVTVQQFLEQGEAA